MTKRPNSDLIINVILCALPMYFIYDNEPKCPDWQTLYMWVMLCFWSTVILGVNLGELLYRFLIKYKILK